jgi:molybdopterin converting factor small subunit
MNIEVEVQLFFDFTQYLPHGSQNRKSIIALESGSTVQTLIDKLRLPPEMPKIILVNGIRPQNKGVLQDGDSVAIFPPMAGG